MCAKIASATGDGVMDTDKVGFAFADETFVALRGLLHIGLELPAV